jgi:23S rRNA (cytosine1962-C5)-methyltransferase
MTLETTMASLPRVVVRRRSARPFFARHPWVFVTSIDRVEGDPAPGDEVEVVSFEGQSIGRGLFNPHSAIRVRLYRWDGGPIDDEFLARTIRRAAAWRAEGLGLAGPEVGARLVFSEADGLSGLTVDRFGRRLVAQFTGLGLYRRREAILEVLASLPDVDGITVRGDRSTAEAEGLRVEEGTARGIAPEGPTRIVEHGIAYEVDLAAGHKTGFYLDQRDNRRAVAALARGRSVLDLYCYSGGFGLNALKAGAADVLGIDSSAPAVALARRNAEINDLSAARFEEGDVSESIERLRAEGRRFGLIVCDPPKFARYPKGIEKALRAYLSLNLAAVSLLEPDGVLATCSCSGLIDRGLFADMIGQVADRSGRDIQILDQRGQAADHPASASCLESDYLKCFVCRVA